MTPQVVTASSDTTLAEALSTARTHRIRHLPVLDGGRLVGIITDRDLRLAMPPAWASNRDELSRALHERTVGEVMTTNVVTIEPDIPMEEAARQMLTNRIGCLPVMEGARLLGILTKADLVSAFTELFSTAPGTRRLEVVVPDRPGELGHVVRIIGVDHRINIAGMVAPPLDNGEGCLAIIHLQVPDASGVVNALRRHGYRVGSPSLAADPDTDLDPSFATPLPRERALAEL
ncbi:MAG TPA: CBS domain-containing protein [Longimicrobiales bacterium]|nr:CBS domain-containing protein [Longimicrobiales bacterium]